MNIILGFGSTETTFQDNEAEAMCDFLDGERGNREYVDGHLIDKLHAWLALREKGCVTKSDEYKTADKYPDRYSTYYTTILSDASNIVVIFHFHHINRRHALSPDGWASLLVSRPVLWERN